MFICHEIRKSILRASHISGHGHIPTSFSIIEMIWATYSVMQHRAEDPHWADRDLFILSKGHAALGYYAVLAHLGYFPTEELATFGAFQSRLGCHPDRKKVPGVEACTGSLGHGIGIAVGVALGQKQLGRPQKTYVLVGDGESNEGSVWESVMVAVNCGLDNLTILYDDNRSQTRCLQIQQPEQCFQAFGAESLVVDGHDIEALRAALVQPPTPGKPKALVCKTQKGFGCHSLASDFFAWHRRSPTASELEELLAELEATKGVRA